MPKRTYQPKRIPRVRKHGFLVRMRTRNGSLVIAARRRKGRHLLSIEHKGIK
jgi:large subunit ribosomal protein L34